METKKKADLSGVKKEIAPYLTKPFLQKAYIDSNKVGAVCRILLSQYSNVEMTAKAGADGKPYMSIKVKGFLSGGELSYEIKVKGKSTRIHDPLSWIDQIEAYDALMN